MTPLPPPFGGGEFVAWRLDQARFGATWDSGEGAYMAGGRWNSKGVRAVYCSIDPATAILEVAAHNGFKALDTVRHVVTALTLTDPSSVHVVDPAQVPNPNWLRPGIPSAGQQDFGDNLLAQHKFIAIPSAVSSFSWNLIFDRDTAAGSYVRRSQRIFALDTRLHSPTAS
ncbi:MAG TPA: RES domain-containing protein [Stellaceae bacterium]|nr:RES domain-containing protein [Stellaceae bacterium]